PSLDNYRPEVGYDPAQPNYALRLTSGDSITHNRFVVPDWGALRFNLHVPNPNGGTLKVSIQGDEPGYENYQPIGNIDLRVADGRVNPGDLAEIPYPIGYADTDTNRIGYGNVGFETFHVDVPEILRGKSAKLKFELEGNDTVYLDDVFFKSTHLMFGNPTLNGQVARPDAANNANNYLIEKPQYAISYNNNFRAPNWVSWQLNQSWIGNVPRPGTNNGYLPPSPVNRAIYPWRADDNELPNTFGMAQPWDYLGVETINAGLINEIIPERGHLTPVDDRDRHLKDIFATFFTTNVLTQDRGLNRGIWSVLESFASNELVLGQGRELYIISGGYGFNTPLRARNGQEDRLIRVPDHTWKIIVVLEPGQTISDITPETGIITVDIPNNEGVVGTAWTDYLISINELERRIRDAANLDGNTYNYNFCLMCRN
ncbi:MULTISPECIES: DNA/RNA non-specific endonuclease, partial [unclassified Microcoleus]|uniref:DNA/RNA non-specific endonuclease n=1 Tax=unclassified Microcoleus TaxID=2642155 RepID=UPI0025E2C5D4